jgi:hypothetical protein
MSARDRSREPALTDRHPQRRCAWAGDLLMRTYHDEEWAVPERDPRALSVTALLEAEFICVAT